MNVTVILPTYNEAENINTLIRAIKKSVPKAKILVVDDNSPDGTAKIANGARVLLRVNNRGLTNSLQDGIAASKTDVIAWMDCDFSHPPSILPTLVKEIELGSDIAIAGRIHNTGLSLLINCIAMLVFGKHITDYTTGFLAVKKSVLHAIPLRGNYGEYCIDLLVRAQRAGYTIKEIPYESPPRLHGASKTSLNKGYGYIITVFRLLLDL